MFEDINISVSRLLELKNKPNKSFHDKRELHKFLNELQHVQLREQFENSNEDSSKPNESNQSNNNKFKLTHEQKQFIHLILPVLIEKHIFKLDEIMNIFDLKISDTYSYTTNGGYGKFHNYE